MKKTKRPVKMQQVVKNTYKVCFQHTLYKRQKSELTTYCTYIRTVCDQVFLATHYVATCQLRYSSKVTFAGNWNACKTRPERARDTSVQVQNLVIKLQQDFHNCHALFARHGMHKKCMQDASETCARHVWDMCQHYLGAKLHCMQKFLKGIIQCIPNLLPSIKIPTMVTTIVC